MAEKKEPQKDISNQSQLVTMLDAVMAKIGYEISHHNVAWLRPEGISAKEYLNEGGERLRGAVVLQMSRGEFRASVQTSVSEPAQFEISFGKTKKRVDRIGPAVVLELKKELDKLADMNFENNVGRLLR